LRSKRVLRILDPITAIREHDQLLTASYAADMADETFVKTAEQEGRVVGPWKMLESRLPPGVNGSLRERSALSKKLQREGGNSSRHVFSDYQIGVFAWEEYDHYGCREYLIEKLGGREAKGLGGRPIIPRVREVMGSSSLSAYEQLVLSGGGTCTDDGQPFGLHPYLYVDSVAFRTGEPIRILAFSQGASLSISQALVLADLHGLTLVTDNALYQRLLALKYQRALQNLSLVDRPSTPRRSLKELERYSIIARTVLMEALSPALLQRLSVEESLRFREENMEALDRFWTKIRDLSHDLDDVAVGPDFDARLVKLIDRTLLPELRSLTDNLDNSKRKMFGSLGTKLATAIPASTVLSVFAGMSGAESLALGVGAGLGAFGISLPSMIDYWQEKKKLRQNWLTFAVDLRQATTPRRPEMDGKRKWWQFWK
jgi:hypothetical protein